MTNDHHVRVILNPVAGGGASIRAWPAARSVLESHTAHWSLVETERPGHATQLAERAVAEGVSTVVVVGGDGTINEVVNGLLGSRGAEGITGASLATGGAAEAAAATDASATGKLETRAPHLGIVPAGAGNDFAKPLSVPKGDVTAATRSALMGTPRPVDVGRANGRYFAIGVGMGLDGYVALEVAGARRLGGLPTYVLAVARALRSYRTATARITIDEAAPFERSISMLAVANGPCQGGGFWICPHARIDDGILDVGTLSAMSPPRVVPLALRVTRGTHVGHPSVSFTKGRRVVVETDTPLPAQLDGEILDAALTRLEVELLPGALGVMT